LQNDSIILSVKRFIKKSPFLTRFLLAYIDNFYFNYSDLQKFLKQNRSKSIKLNLGSGPMAEGSFMNVDMESYPGVTLCADVHSLPIRENSVDAVCCMQLLEHVVDPHKVVDEAWRVLKPGGEIFLSAPFMYPFHEAPIDLNRWTKNGLRHIMKDFHLVNIGVLGGPTAALIEVFHGWLSILLSFNSERVYQLVHLFLLPIFQPFKMLDLILLNKYRSSYRVATALFFYGKKSTLREEGRDYSLNSLIR
jgi:SAM-dependent methyltransferase